MPLKYQLNAHHAGACCCSKCNFDENVASTDLCDKGADTIRQERAHFQAGMPIGKGTIPTPSRSAASCRRARSQNAPTAAKPFPWTGVESSLAAGVQRRRNSRRRPVDQPVGCCEDPVNACCGWREGARRALRSRHHEQERSLRICSPFW
jgi:hypothetical protein